MKSCARCKLALDTAQERHVKIEDKTGKEVHSKLYYHRECWREIMTAKAALQNLNKEALGLIGSFRQSLGFEDKPTYEIGEVNGE